jgi:hypothetical protein
MGRARAAMLLFMKASHDFSTEVKRLMGLAAYFTMALLLLVGLTACVSKPPEPDVKSAIELMSHTCNRCYSVLNIEQTPGETAEAGYSVAFSAILEMKKKAFLVKKKDIPVDLEHIKALKSGKQDKALPAGAKYAINGRMIFVESQKDWIPVALSLDKFSRMQPGRD